MEKRRRFVNYERSILTYIDILGFRELIATRSAGEISRSIRIVRDVVPPRQRCSFQPRFLRNSILAMFAGQKGQHRLIFEP